MFFCHLFFGQVVRIFTSSTFTDMLMERNTLMEYVYPKIKEYCREKHGLEYQVVDMRWGVRDEMTDEHMTTALCMNELRGCQKYSMGPNFIYFGGQKWVQIYSYNCLSLIKFDIFFILGLMGSIMLLNNRPV